MTIKLDYQTVKNLRTPGRYTDALIKGLHIWIKPNGKKYWIFRYSYENRQHNISLGSFPTLSIAEARIKAQQSRDDLDRGINPVAVKNSAKAQKLALQTKKLSFKEFAEACIKSKRAEWTNQKHGDQWEYTLSEFAYPFIGNMGLDEIETEDILKILTPIWTTKTETASRLRGRIEWILASATTRKLRTGVNPALWRGHLQTILPAPNKVKKVAHHKALPYRQVPGLITNLRETATMSALALEFTILNASRTGEVIDGLREEVQGDIWIIPASRMKAKKEHRVPLCQRSLDVLATARAMDKDSKYLFSVKGKKLTNMAMPMMLRRAKIDATVHGFRSSFRDWVSEETNHPSEVAEMALAHAIGNKVEAAYRRKDLLEKRRTLLLDWESYCSIPVQNNIYELQAA
ncbi:integrase arm-type DNA-binding domain-containing protein [Polynucleobacter sp. MWH-Jannik1A5]|uniref:tyrosine-type recombinase/integrase n=1 Tax=Polynucleobacter sp. MWH-Jannik1A5 TaxID=1855890 RepID=UPI001C0C1D6E|nr:integrase arm-type DNA-binding domain-containing protein [Polynucleobacter sp. MWH-Jannik1A5]MBU3547479.1 integrase arm-type DNA-binding domain-containing protein [Polynucleobacter sp. MWH-Jannik1A5]